MASEVFQRNLCCQVTMSSMQEAALYGSLQGEAAVGILPSLANHLCNAQEGLLMQAAAQFQQGQSQPIDFAASFLYFKCMQSYF